MKGKPIIRTLILATIAAGGVFLLHTDGMTVEQWDAQSWLDLTRLALKMNGAWAAVVVLLFEEKKNPV